MTEPNRQDRPKLGFYRRHILICTGSRCTQNGESEALFKMLGEKFKAAGIDQGPLRVKRTRSACFATCKAGPLMAVHPDGVWYCDVTPENLDRIIEQHFVGGEPVEDLIYARGPECHVLSEAAE